MKEHFAYLSGSLLSLSTSLSMGLLNMFFSSTQEDSAQHFMI